MQRRQFLRHAGIAGSTAALAACAGTRPAARGPGELARAGSAVASLAPVRASEGRITGIYVCTRPFRAQGPRIEAQRLGEQTVVHNYGHGGSGWSLSWGSAAAALELVHATGARRIGVIGCGAIGLTTARLAQRQGLEVRIYAKALPPDVFSMRASGLWTPDSRICTAEYAKAFAPRWDALARRSFAEYQTLLGLPGDPVEWIDGYGLSDDPPGSPVPEPADEPAYGDFDDPMGELAPPHSVPLPPGSTPFPQRYVRRYTTLMFNIANYVRMLLDDYLRAGGTLEVRAFGAPAELAALPERTLVNATGYGARALFGDTSVIPVRGQTARLIPQPEVNYGLSTHTLSMVPRREGLLVQAFGQSGDFDNPSLQVHREESLRAVDELAAIMASMRPG